MHIWVHVFAWMCLFPLDLYLGVDLLDHLVTNSVSNCLRSCQTVVPNGCPLRTASFQLSSHCPFSAALSHIRGPSRVPDLVSSQTSTHGRDPGRIFLHPLPARLSGVRGQR